MKKKNKKRSRKVEYIYYILSVIGIILFAAGCFCLEGWIVMFFWNWLAVSLFSAPELDYIKALGITVLVNFLTNILAAKFRRSK